MRTKAVDEEQTPAKWRCDDDDEDDDEGMSRRLSTMSDKDVARMSDGDLVGEIWCSSHR